MRVRDRATGEEFEATRWVGNGDHPEVGPHLVKDGEDEIYRDSGFGRIQSQKGYVLVRPGDYLIDHKGFKTQLVRAPDFDQRYESC